MIVQVMPTRPSKRAQTLDPVNVMSQAPLLARLAGTLALPNLSLTWWIEHGWEGDPALQGKRSASHAKGVVEPCHG